MERGAEAKAWPHLVPTLNIVLDVIGPENTQSFGLPDDVRGPGPQRELRIGDLDFGEGAAERPSSGSPAHRMRHAR